MVLLSLLFLHPRRTASQETHPPLPIPRNAAWNDFQRQVIAAHTNLETVRLYLTQHQTEVRLDEYDVPTLRALQDSRDELRQAEKDLQVIQDELSYKESERSVITSARR